MELVSSDKERGLQTPVWKSYQSLLLEAGCSVSLRPPPTKGLGPSALLWRPGRKEGQAQTLPHGCVSAYSPAVGA